MLHEPWYIWALTLTGAIGLPALTAVMASRGARAARQGRLAGPLVAAVAGIWLLASSVLADSGAYHRASGQAAPWFAIVAGATFAIALLIGCLPAARVMLAAPGAAARLTVPHTVRVVGIVFVVLAAQGRLPWLFALPAGLGDLAVGLTAPSVARRLAADPAAPGAVRFHLLGALDLIVALTLGFLCGLGPVSIIPIPPSTIPLGQLPLALVPTVAVPTALALHVAALTRIRAARRATQTAASQRPGTLTVLPDPSSH